jgi:hypothetical protein
MLNQPPQLRCLVPVEFDIRSSVQKNTKLPFKRLRVVQNLSELRLPDVRTGIVFIFAAWSGPAVMALRRLTALLSTLDLGSLDVVILDNDSMTGEDMIQLFGHVFHGAGETLWVRDGRVVAEMSELRPESEALIVSRTRELL